MQPKGEPFGAHLNLSQRGHEGDTYDIPLASNAKRVCNHAVHHGTVYHSASQCMSCTVMLRRRNSTQQHGLSVGSISEDAAADAEMSVVSIYLIERMTGMPALEPISRFTDMQAFEAG